MIHGPLGEPDLDLQCSRAGCSEPPVAQIHWRNPKIHDASRRKTWLACEAHLEYLTEFLTARDFPVTVLPLPTEEDV